MINENIVVAIIISVAPTLAVVASLIISLKSSKAQDDKQNSKLDKIHVLTNDNFSKALAKIDRLEKIIREQDKKLKS